ncbi:hypothetical protein HII28_07380 [Planctomonas sp. JC2975]|uniref:PadR family transcriptional regulator n=1 Tax=Planctomonas sp. JC2975 TaxID=2729626 RepID=UPI0014753A92|nr:helix-turn-helix transcriptional regulator [Planctomonas sp. JC2975]NNC11695.1 hypothetical protein [Planctomonas sp. JC2975]
MSRSTTRLMVLGVVAYRGPIGGYGIEKTFNEWAVQRWASIAPPSIYQQLKTLNSEELIEPVAPASGRATEYRCTTAGQEELHRLLLDLLHEREVRPLSLVPLLHFTPTLPAAELLAGLSARIEAIDVALSLQDEMLERSAFLAPSHVAEIFRLNAHGLRGDRAWCAEFLARLGGNRPSADW